MFLVSQQGGRSESGDGELSRTVEGGQAKGMEAGEGTRRMVRLKGHSQHLLCYWGILERLVLPRPAVPQLKKLGEL